MKHFHFKVTLSGYGDNVDEAWNDAVNGFTQDPGVTPDNEDCIDFGEEDQEEEE